MIELAEKAHSLSFFDSNCGIFFARSSGSLAIGAKTLHHNCLYLITREGMSAENFRSRFFSARAPRRRLAAPFACCTPTGRIALSCSHRTGEPGVP